MKNKNNNRNIWYVIIGLIILILFLNMSKPTTIDNNSTATSGSGAGSTGGGGGGGTIATTESQTESKTPVIWNFWNWFNPDECSRNSDCSNKCANPNNAVCNNGECGCSLVQPTSETILFERITPDCTKDSECNKCAVSSYDACVNGECLCVAPTTDPVVGRIVTPECSRDTDCNKCANSASDKCVSGECACVAPVTPATVVANTCSDTDSTYARSGKAYDYDGTCADNTGTIQANDFCSGGSLVEYYCSTDNKCASTTVNCATVMSDRGSICMDGFCTKIVV